MFKSLHYVLGGADRGHMIRITYVMVCEVPVISQCHTCSRQWAVCFLFGEAEKNSDEEVKLITAENKKGRAYFSPSKATQTIYCLNPIL